MTIAIFNPQNFFWREVNIQIYDIHSIDDGSDPCAVEIRPKDSLPIRPKNVPERKTDSYWHEPQCQLSASVFVSFSLD